MTTRSARWPGTRRPRSVSPALMAGSTHAARMARHSESALWGPKGGVPAGHSGDERVTAQASPGHGSTGSTGASVPERDDRARPGRGRRGRRRGRPRGRPTGGGPWRRRTGRGWAASTRRCRARRTAGCPSSATSWACSTRGISGVRPTVGASASRAARTAASPMPWICVAIPRSAARAARARRSSGAVEPHAVGRRSAGVARREGAPAARAAPRSASRATRRRTS